MCDCKTQELSICILRCAYVQVHINKNDLLSRSKMQSLTIFLSFSQLLEQLRQDWQHRTFQANGRFTKRINKSNLLPQGILPLFGNGPVTMFWMSWLGTIPPRQNRWRTEWYNREKWDWALKVVFLCRKITLSNSFQNFGKLSVFSLKAQQLMNFCLPLFSLSMEGFS